MTADGGSLRAPHYGHHPWCDEDFCVVDRKPGHGTGFLFFGSL
jgi:coproporphyrinogen III oxidase